MDTRPSWYTPEQFEQMLAKVREALARPDYSHATHRSWCGADIVYLYRREPTSPSGVLLAASAPDCPEVRALVSRIFAGPTRGDLAARYA